MAFILLVAFSAFFVAGCAAFFSIKGLIVLFSGSALAVGIMASSLEIGKLVAASFLHTYWNISSRLLKLYLCLAVFILMCVTSLGIFGFLTGAYQEHSTKVNTFDTKIAALTLEKSVADQAILERTSRIKTLADLRQAQEQRIQTAGNLKGPREQAYKAVTEANEEIQKKELEVVEARQKSVDLEKEISELKITLGTTTDIGSFKFLAAAIGTDVDTAVRYFIFALIFVFDPLAVTLVLALNKLIEIRAAKKVQELSEYEASLANLNDREASNPLPVNLSESLGVFIDPDDFEPTDSGENLENATNAYEEPSVPAETYPTQETPEITEIYKEDPVSSVPISEIEQLPTKKSSIEPTPPAPTNSWQRVLK